MPGKPQQRKLPFAFSAESALLNDEIQKRITKKAMALRDSLLSPQNVYRMKHGRRWVTMHASDPDEPSEVRSHSTEIEVSRARVVDHDLRQLAEFLSGASSKVHGLFMRSMTETLDDTTRRSGNVVSARGKSFKESFEEMLTKITFGVDRYGTPSRPQALVPPSVMTQIEEAAGTPDPEYDARIAKITRQKEREAIADEARRISRYRLAR
jgi:hypothetical protein